MISNEHILYALLLTLGAGLSTGIGSAIAFFARPTNKSLLSFALGLSGGVMVYVAFVELFQEAKVGLQGVYGHPLGSLYTTLAFFGGILLIGLIDRLVPSVENPHEPHTAEEMDRKPRNPKLMRMGLMTALAIAIHNFPEGIATFITALEDPTLGVAIAAAVAIQIIHSGCTVLKAGFRGNIDALAQLFPCQLIAFSGSIHLGNIVYMGNTFQVCEQKNVHNILL